MLTTNTSAMYPSCIDWKFFSFDSRYCRGSETYQEGKEQLESELERFFVPLFTLCFLNYLRVAELLVMFGPHTFGA